MRIHTLHAWNVSPREAVALQRTLAEQIDCRTPLTRWELIAGADISYARFSKVFHAGVVVLRAADLAIVESQTVVGEGAFPYVPGLLSFREAPALLEAFARLRTQPDVVMLDGQGYAHPRRMGLACHLGLWLDCPTIGCAKSLLIGKHRALGRKPGSVAALRDGKETIGMAVRTRFDTKPVYVSAGHRIDPASAVRVVLSSCAGYRLPEPTRQAHLLVNAARAAAC